MKGCFLHLGYPLPWFTPGTSERWHLTLAAVGRAGGTGSACGRAQAVASPL